jgi:hypothetical protein
VTSVQSDYVTARIGDWRLIMRRGQWGDELQNHVLGKARSEDWTRHPSTIEIRGLFDGKERHLYLKIFHRSRGISFAKDALRQSKAWRFWRQSVLLAKHAFPVPPVVAAGEQRRLGVLRRAFVLTERVQGQPAPVFLRGRGSGVPDGKMLASKRAGIQRCAELVRRFHQCGFVHGDLVASNILLFETPRGELQIYFMDNDRTRRYPGWLPQSLWKRNLVQLNRMPLPGISLQDRMRFFHAYLGKRNFSPAEGRLAQWLESKTRLRRKECDGADPSINFRALMRWLPEPERK